MFRLSFLVCVLTVLASVECSAASEPTVDEIRVAISVAQGHFRGHLNGLAWRVNHAISEPTKMSIPFNNTHSRDELQAALTRAAVIEMGGCVPAVDRPGYVCDMVLGLQLDQKVCAEMKCDDKFRYMGGLTKGRFSKVGDRWIADPIELR